MLPQKLNRAFENIFFKSQSVQNDFTDPVYGQFPSLASFIIKQNAGNSRVSPFRLHLYLGFVYYPGHLSCALTS